MATTTQGYIAIPGGAYTSVFTGGILAAELGTAELQGGVVGVQNHMFRIYHVSLNVADAATATTETGFKLGTYASIHKPH